MWPPNPQHERCWSLESLLNHGRLGPDRRSQSFQRKPLFPHLLPAPHPPRPPHPPPPPLPSSLHSGEARRASLHHSWSWCRSLEILELCLVLRCTACFPFQHTGGCIRDKWQLWYDYDSNISGIMQGMCLLSRGKIAEHQHENKYWHLKTFWSKCALSLKTWNLPVAFRHNAPASSTAGPRRTTLSVSNKSNTKELC